MRGDEEASIDVEGAEHKEAWSWSFLFRERKNGSA
jgi:hypothetical protein